MIFAFVLAFLNWDGNNPISFAGLENFVKMFGNKRFLASLRNTVVYCLATVPLTLIAALGLAVILNQKVRGRNFFRTVSFFPYVASLVAVAAVWNMLFSPAKSGPVNMILYNLGVAAKDLPKWSAGKNWVMFTVILFSVWKNMGYYMVIYLAGLQGINAELYEASSVDGAKGYQTFFKITLPMLSPTIFIVLLLSTVNLLKEYALVQGITSGGPGTSTTYIVQYMFNQGFTQYRYGYASAIGVVVSIVFIIIAAIQFKATKGGEIE